MTSKEMIIDIQMFINEAYSDNEPLQENQIKSKQVFNDYCNTINQSLERLEELEKAINKEYTHWKRIKYNDEMNGHSNNTADYCVEFLSFLKEILLCQKD